MPTNENYERLATLVNGDEGERIRSVDRDMRSHNPSTINIILTSRSSRAVEVGPLITQTDRELRRSVAILDPQSQYTASFGEAHYYFGTPEDRPRPISPRYGGLELVDAAPGSFHMLVTGYGEVLSLLTSKPLQALVAVFALGQGFGSVRFWPHRKKDSLKGISARQALDVVTAFEGDTATLMQGDKPSLEVKRNRVMDEGQWIARSKHPGGDIDAIHVPTLADEVNLLDDIVTRGRRLTYIRNYPDGTQDIIYLEG